jgi:hypothetical protein
MTETPPTSFRVPSKYLVFLEMLAKQNQTNRTQELCNILDEAIARYLERNSKPPREKK